MIPILSPAVIGQALWLELFDDGKWVDLSRDIEILPSSEPLFGAIPKDVSGVFVQIPLMVADLLSGLPGLECHE